MLPQLTTLVHQTRTHVSRQQSQQHRPTASERTEPRRSHAAFFNCYSVNCSLCGWQITSHQLEQTFCVVLTKKIVVLNLKREHISQSLVSLQYPVSYNSCVCSVMSPICVENAVYIFYII